MRNRIAGEKPAAAPTAKHSAHSDCMPSNCDDKAKMQSMIRLQVLDDARRAAADQALSDSWR
jgi:hypothetical protein